MRPVFQGEMGVQYFGHDYLHNFWFENRLNTKSTNVLTWFIKLDFLAAIEVNWKGDVNATATTWRAHFGTHDRQPTAYLILSMLLLTWIAT